MSATTDQELPGSPDDRRSGSARPESARPGRPQSPTEPSRDGLFAEADAHRRSGALPSRRAARRYWLTMAILVVLAAASILGVLAYDNPMEFGSDRKSVVVGKRGGGMGECSVGGG